MEKEFIAEIVQNCPNAACKFYKAQLDMSHSHNKPTYIPEVQSPSKFVIIAYFFESGKVHSQSVHTYLCICFVTQFELASVYFTRTKSYSQIEFSKKRIYSRVDSEDRFSIFVYLLLDCWETSFSEMNANDFFCSFLDFLKNLI